MEHVEPLVPPRCFLETFNDHVTILGDVAPKSLSSPFVMPNPVHTFTILMNTSMAQGDGQRGGTQASQNEVPSTVNLLRPVSIFGIDKTK